MSDLYLEGNEEMFLGYMQEHSKTPLALVSKTQVEYLMKLAGYPDYREEREWSPWHYEDMQPYLDRAKKRLHGPQLKLLLGGKK